MKVKTAVCGRRESLGLGSKGLCEALVSQGLPNRRPGTRRGAGLVTQANRRGDEQKLRAAAVGGIVQGPPIEDWQAPLTKQEGRLAPVVALGKFDAMHVGHRALAEAAAALGGHPWLISFSGMAEVLNWPPQLPIVPISERPAVLKSWAPYCGGLSPCMRYLPFGDIRTMSPEAFVELLAVKLGAVGVVAGENYRFGYKAAGDALMLQELGEKYGMKVTILDLVSSKSQSSVENVSTSKVRKALAKGALAEVHEYLDRRYKLVADVNLQSCLSPVGMSLELPAESFLNQPPAEGAYQADVELLKKTGDSGMELIEGKVKTEVRFTKLGLQVPGFGGYIDLDGNCSRLIISF